MSEVLVSKLINSEILISEIVKNDDGTTTFVKPLQIGMVEKDGQPQMILVDFKRDLGIEEDITMSNSSILYQYPPSENLINGYKQQFSNIVMPDTQISELIE